MQNVAQDREAERAVIGALLIDPRMMQAPAVAALHPADFGDLDFRAIFQAMRRAGDDFDTYQVQSLLLEAGNERASPALDEAEGATLSAARVEKHARTVANQAERRRLWEVGLQLQQLAEQRLEPDARQERAREVIGQFTDRQQPSERRAFSEPREYTLEDLRADEERQLVSITAGWGPHLNAMLGGGLAPGEIVAIGAKKAGAGKTAFLMQLADALALRNLEILLTGRQEPLCPVMILSEMDPKALDRRTLARFVGAPASFFRSGAAARTPWNREEVERAYREAEALLTPGGTFARMAKWQRVARPDVRDARLLMETLASDLSAWTDGLRKTGDVGDRELWPVVVVDPVQRWQDQALPEVEALNLLAETLDEYADANGWIVLATSDTNKAAATGSSGGDNLAAVFRGSYKLAHSADCVIVLDAEKAVEGERNRSVTVRIDKNRWGPTWGEAHFTWWPATGQFDPAAEADRTERNAATKSATPARNREAEANPAATVPPAWEGLL